MSPAGNEKGGPGLNEPGNDPSPGWGIGAGPDAHQRVRLRLECEERLEQRFDCIYIDEIQDMAAYDIDLIELILRSKVKLTLVGDPEPTVEIKTSRAFREKFYL